ncbi:MAG: DUF2142 domain-containing protein [Acetobacteraceae bacterium]
MSATSSVTLPPFHRFVALVCLIAGLSAGLILLVLTPPFQVPDEPAQFERAWQVSQGQPRAEVHAGRAGGIEPRAFARLTRRILGTDAILAPRSLRRLPLAGDLALLRMRLRPNRREFLDFTNTAAYPPIDYLPQAVGIRVGRAIGLGPLGLLYAARLANILAAVTVLATAMGLMPLGRPAALAFGLLPMAVYEYASAAQDALVISGAFLLTALGLRALLRGTWRPGEVAAAMLAGLVACVAKPVYLPLLLIAAPAALERGQRRNQLMSLGSILTVVLGTTLLWLYWDAGRVIAFEPGADVGGQLRFLLGHPLATLRAMMAALRHFWPFYLRSWIGAFGWLTLGLPIGAYELIGAAVLAAALIREPGAPRLRALALGWGLLLVIGSVALVLLAMDLDATPVGGAMVLGAQGRYLLPLGGLLAALLGGTAPMPAVGSRAAPVLLTLVAVIGLAGVGLAARGIVAGFGVF